MARQAGANPASALAAAALSLSLSLFGSLYLRSLLVAAELPSLRQLHQLRHEGDGGSSGGGDVVDSNSNYIDDHDQNFNHDNNSSLSLSLTRFPIPTSSR